MTRKMMRAKIHRATVTQADVDYEGSITIDRTLMDATDLLPNEAVCVWDVTNGNRFETYAVEGPADSGVVCVNGAAAPFTQMHPESRSPSTTYVSKRLPLVTFQTHTASFGRRSVASMRVRSIEMDPS